MRMSSVIKKWLKKGGLKPTDIYITKRGGVYNTKYFPEFRKKKKKRDSDGFIW